MKPGTYLICFCRWFVIQDFRQSEILEAPEYNSITVKNQSTLRREVKGDFNIHGTRYF